MFGKKFAKPDFFAVGSSIFTSSLILLTESIAFSMVGSTVESVESLTIPMLCSSVKFELSIVVVEDFIGATINNAKMQPKPTDFSNQKFDVPSAESNLNNQTNKPIAMMFFMIASTGVIGIKSPKQPQLPEFPLIKVVYVK